MVDQESLQWQSTKHSGTDPVFKVSRRKQLFAEAGLFPSRKRGTAHICASIEHRSHTENDYDEFFAPHGEIERVIGVITGLWCQHNMGFFASAMLEAFGSGCISIVGSLVIQENGARDVLEFAVICACVQRL